MSDKRSPLSIRETILIVVFVAGMVLQWQNLSGKMDRLTDRVIDIGAAQGKAAAEFRVHTDLPGHPLEQKDVVDLGRRVTLVEALCQEAVRVSMRRADAEPARPASPH